jgi:hypothetical protein
VPLDELSRIAGIHVRRPSKAAALWRRGTARPPTGRHRDPGSEVDELVPMPLIENLRSVSLIQGELPPQTAFRPQTLLCEAVRKTASGRRLGLPVFDRT